MEVYILLLSFIHVLFLNNFTYENIKSFLPFLITSILLIYNKFNHLLHRYFIIKYYITKSNKIYIKLYTLYKLLVV